MNHAVLLGGWLRTRSMAKSKLDFVAKFFGRLVRVRATDKDIPPDCVAMYFKSPGERIHLRPHLRGKAFFAWIGHEFQHASDWWADEELVEQFWDDFSEIIYRDDVLARCGLKRVTPE